MAKLESGDPDQEKVLEILRAAKRGPWDPDVDLAEALSRLLGSDDGKRRAMEVLRKLADDVDSD